MHNGIVMTSCSLEYKQMFELRLSNSVQKYPEKNKFGPGVSLYYNKQSWQVIKHDFAIDIVING